MCSICHSLVSHFRTEKAFSHSHPSCLLGFVGLLISISGSPLASACVLTLQLICYRYDDSPATLKIKHVSEPPALRALKHSEYGYL